MSKTHTSKGSRHIVLYSSYITYFIALCIDYENFRNILHCKLQNFISFVIVKHCPSLYCDPCEILEDDLARSLVGSIQVLYEHFCLGGGVTRKASIAYLVRGGVEGLAAKCLFNRFEFISTL